MIYVVNTAMREKNAGNLVSHCADQTYDYFKEGTITPIEMESLSSRIENHRIDRHSKNSFLHSSNFTNFSAILLKLNLYNLYLSWLLFDLL